MITFATCLLVLGTYLAKVPPVHSLFYPISNIHVGKQLDRRTFISTLSFPLILGPTLSGNAACLPGDESLDCIGFYKVPLNEIANYGNTPEELAQLAPGIRWVPPLKEPKSYKEARREMDSLQAKSIALKDLVLKGKMTDAGVEILRIIPRVTLAGGLMIRTIAAADFEGNDRSQKSDFGLRAIRMESAYIELLYSLNACDILLGQALRNELGSTISAQIQILAELGEANESWNELQKAIPNDFQPSSTDMRTSVEKKNWYMT